MMDRRPAHGCGRIKRTIPSFLQNMDRRSRRGAAMTVSHSGDTVNAAGRQREESIHRTSRRHNHTALLN